MFPMPRLESWEHSHDGQRDGLRRDTRTIPFAWVPDGAAVPTDWLMRHPDAVRVAATLEQPACAGSTTHGVASDCTPAVKRRGHAGPIRNTDLPTDTTWPVPGNPRRRPSAYWLTAAGVRPRDA